MGRGRSERERAASRLQANIVRCYSKMEIACWRPAPRSQSPEARSQSSVRSSSCEHKSPVGGKSRRCEHPIYSCLPNNEYLIDIRLPCLATTGQQGDRVIRAAYTRTVCSGLSVVSTRSCYGAARQHKPIAYMHVNTIYTIYVSTSSVQTADIIRILETMETLLCVSDVVN